MLALALAHQKLPRLRLQPWLKDTAGSSDEYQE
jgi:hypothetical protein